MSLGNKILAQCYVWTFIFFKNLRIQVGIFASWVQYGLHREKRMSFLSSCCVCARKPFLMLFFSVSMSLSRCNFSVSRFFFSLLDTLLSPCSQKSNMVGNNAAILERRKMFDSKEFIFQVSRNFEKKF